MCEDIEIRSNKTTSVEKRDQYNTTQQWETMSGVCDKWQKTKTKTNQN